MTISEAQIIVDQFHRNNGNYTEEEFFIFTEAIALLIQETKNSDYMMELGGYYYEQKNYELALKYYNMAAEQGNESAIVGLGYIWYYGRTGTVDYEKAFHYFSMAGRNPIAEYKIADMYHYGYYVEKDDSKYKEIVERLYRAFCKTNNVEDPLPELCTRLAGIREAEGNIPEAIRLLKEGKSMLSSRIGYNPFFGNFSIMRGLIHDLYRLIPLDKEHLGLFDLYEVFKEPVTVTFNYKERKYTITSSREEDGSVAVCFLGKWYRSIDDMLMRAELNGCHMTLSAWRFKNITIISE